MGALRPGAPGALLSTREGQSLSPAGHPRRDVRRSNESVQASNAGAGRQGHVHSGPGVLDRQSEGEGKRCVLHPEFESHLFC